MSETPLYDELEAKWNETCDDTCICDAYARVVNLSTGQVWFEDDEGNEVFPEPQYAKGGLLPNRPETGVMVDLSEDYCPVAVVPKRETRVGTCGLVDCGTKRHKPKRHKLFGRNQGTNGTL